MEPALLNSEAFRSLSRCSILVYIHFLRKRRLSKEKGKGKKRSYRIANNGEIVFTYREACSLGISERAFRDSIDELQRKGFIDIAQYGKGGRSGESTLYFIDSRWKYYNNENFQPPKKPRIKDTIQGRGWAAYNAKKKLKAGDKNDSAITDKNDSGLSKNSKKTPVKNDSS